MEANKTVQPLRDHLMFEQRHHSAEKKVTDLKAQKFHRYTGRTHTDRHTPSMKMPYLHGLTSAGRRRNR